MKNSTATNSKPTVRFALNFFEKTITGTKASFNKANKGFGPEYEELTSKMAAHPDFTLEVKEQKSKTTKRKRSYEGLNTKFIEDYIATLDDATAMKAEYEAVQQMAKNCDTKVFSLCKKWFITKFGNEEDGFDMEAGKERITQFRLAQAEKMAITNLTVMAAVTAAEQAN